MLFQDNRWATSLSVSQLATGGPGRLRLDGQTADASPARSVEQSFTSFGMRRVACLRAEHADELVGPADGSLGFGLPSLPPPLLDVEQPVQLVEEDDRLENGHAGVIPGQRVVRLGRPLRDERYRRWLLALGHGCAAVAIAREHLAEAEEIDGLERES